MYARMRFILNDKEIELTSLVTAIATSEEGKTIHLSRDTFLWDDDYECDWHPSCLTLGTKEDPNHSLMLSADDNWIHVEVPFVRFLESPIIDLD